jgi:hypothetical protein
MPESICRCGKRLDAASNVNDINPPEPGDVSICLYCGTINMFALDMSLRQLTEDEERETMRGPAGAALYRLRQEILGTRHRDKR